MGNYDAHAIPRATNVGNDAHAIPHATHNFHTLVAIWDRPNVVGKFSVDNILDTQNRLIRHPFGNSTSALLYFSK